MIRLTTIDPATATGHAKPLLDQVRSQLGMVPNMTRGMAASPAALEGYLAFSGALAKGLLKPQLRELIALTVAETNGCNYCLSAHTAIGGALKLGSAELNAARDADSTDSRTRAMLRFAREVVEKRGHVDDGSVARLRAAGVTDGEITEIVAHVAVNVFTNYFNTVALTEIDFPMVTAGERKAA